MYILDLETNGLSLSDIEITQIAYLELYEDSFNIKSEFNSYYYCNNLKDSSKITGLTAEKLAVLSNGNLFDMDLILPVLNKLENQIVIGQNISFDCTAIDALYIRNGIPIIPKYTLDIIRQFSPEGTLMNLEWIVKHHMSEEGKEELRNKFLNSGFHDALYDVYSVYYLIKNNVDFYKRLKQFIKTVPR